MDYSITESIGAKIRELVHRYEILAAENSEMKEKILLLKRDNENKSLTINELKERLDKVQLTKAFEHSSDDKSQAKRKVSALVREIDNCIQLLDN